MISATVSGTVGRDAELRQPRGGDQVLSFTVASRRYAAGQESTDWISVSFWGKRAEAIAKHVTKGSRIAARGALHVREYEKAGGGAGWSIELRADDVELLGGPKTTDNASASRPRAVSDDFQEHGGDSDIPF